MKKILRIMAAVLTAALAVSALAFSAFAEDELEDVEVNIRKPKFSTGEWGQSVTFDRIDFNPERITPETKILVEYEIDGKYDDDADPCELIFQSFNNKDFQWKKIPPSEFTETSAVFTYEDIVDYYRADYFTDVDAVHVGDCGRAKLKVTKFVATNCKPKEEVTTTEATTTTVTTTEATTAATTEATTAATTAATEVPENDPESGGLSVTLIIIIVGAAVLVAGIVVTVIVVKNNKKRFY